MIGNKERLAPGEGKVKGWEGMVIKNLSLWEQYRLVVTTRICSSANSVVANLVITDSFFAVAKNFRDPGSQSFATNDTTSFVIQ